MALDPIGRLAQPWGAAALNTGRLRMRVILQDEKSISQYENQKCCSAANFLNMRY
jgi:hypothetical protein